MYVVCVCVFLLFVALLLWFVYCGLLFCFKLTLVLVCCLLIAAVWGGCFGFILFCLFDLRF